MSSEDSIDDIRRLSDSIEPTVRLAVLGAPGVGKSAISVRFMTRRYIGEYEPCAENNYIRDISFGEDVIRYELKDTANNGNSSSHISWASCLAVVYSIDDRKSFATAENILKDVSLHLKMEDNKENVLNYALIANKNDLEHLRSVTSSEGQTMAREYKAGFWEMSAADDVESTHGPLRAMIVDTYFNVTNKPINPIPQNLTKIENKSTIERIKKISQDVPRERKKSRKSSTSSEKFRKNSVSHILMENFALVDFNNNQEIPEEDDTKEAERQKTPTFTRKDRLRSSLRRDKQNSMKKMHKTQSCIELKPSEQNTILEEEKLSEKCSKKLTEKLPENVIDKVSEKPTEKLEEKPVDKPTEKLQRNNSIKQKPNNLNTAVIHNAIFMPNLSPMMKPRANKPITNNSTNVSSETSSENPLENWNALMLAPGYDLSRILSRGRPEKRSTRSKFSSIFKQKIIETAE